MRKMAEPVDYPTPELLEKIAEVATGYLKTFGGQQLHAK